jgi:hypothetical protein
MPWPAEVGPTCLSATHASQACVVGCSGQSRHGGYVVNPSPRPLPSKRTVTRSDSAPDVVVADDSMLILSQASSGSFHYHPIPRWGPHIDPGRLARDWWLPPARLTRRGISRDGAFSRSGERYHLVSTGIDDDVAARARIFLALGQHFASRGQLDLLPLSSLIRCAPFRVRSSITSLTPCWTCRRARILYGLAPPAALTDIPANRSSACWSTTASTPQHELLRQCLKRCRKGEILLIDGEILLIEEGTNGKHQHLHR